MYEKQKLLALGTYHPLIGVNIAPRILIPGVSIYGPIGIGKSTLLERFDLNKWSKLKEPVKDNPYLEDFYKEPERWASIMQIHLLSQKLHEYRAAIGHGKPIIHDWGDTDIYSLALYKSGVLSEREWDSYLKYAALTNVYVPKIIFYLYGTDEAFERTMSRSRECEKSISKDYLKQLDEQYRSHFDVYEKAGAIIHEIYWTDKIPMNERLREIESILSRNGLPGGIRYDEE